MLNFYRDGLRAWDGTEQCDILEANLFNPINKKMDIKDKMLEAISDITAFTEKGYDSSIEIVGQEQAAESCAKIAEQERDNFAIEFARWMHSNTVYVGNAMYDTIEAKPLNSPFVDLLELLELFKQSKSNN